MQTEVPTQSPPACTKAINSLSLIFMILGAVSAVLVLAHRSLFQGWQRIPNTALTTLCFLIAAASAKIGVPPRYKWSIVVGMAFSALGDLFLMLPKDRFVPGVASFLVAHICYLWALTSDTPLASRRLPFLIAGGVGVILLAFIWAEVTPSLRVPVVTYTLALLGMAAQANARALSLRNRAATFAAIGAILFVASDAGLAINRFGHPFPWRHLIVLGTYFAAQAGIALSVVLHSGRSAKTEHPA
jgi:uncharacterized membrane protein YhhN